MSRVLLQEFNQVLQEYKQASAQYTKSLQSNADPASFQSLAQQMVVSDQPLTTVSASSVADCQQVCSNTVNCKAGTFYPDPQFCVLTAGGVAKPSPNTTAFMQSPLYYYDLMQSWNDRLMALHDKIADQLKVEETKYIADKPKHQDIKDRLARNRQLLQQERKQLANIRLAQREMNAELEVSQDTLTMVRYWYILYVVLGVALFLLLSRYALF